ncbi:hypothetical protein QVD17_41226 [Tagetes erecta]|uniref:Uncharacterized protein n=1 Tax=Tagetes erecta TaxID=13708 RepID=A0AAD8JUL8_TARER|nr:hypothetical protein QVD17_41226 [Tagetes erecta]
MFKKIKIQIIESLCIDFLCYNFIVNVVFLKLRDLPSLPLQYTTRVEVKNTPTKTQGARTRTWIRWNKVVLANNLYEASASQFSSLKSLLTPR